MSAPDVIDERGAVPERSPIRVRTDLVNPLTGLGLGEAKALVEEAPKNVLEALKKDAAEEALAKLTEAGAVAKLV